MYLLCCKGQSLRCSPGQGNPRHCSVTLYVGEGTERDQCCLLCSLQVFSHFPHHPQANWALLVLIPGWVGLCMFWAPVGLSNELSCEAGSFSHCRLNPTGVFSQTFESLFPSAGTLGCRVCCQVIQPPPCLKSSPSGCPSPPLLQVWMNVSFLTPWLSDFHTIRFPVSSGCFLFLNCCCPPFGCARRHSVSTYASILARNPRICIWRRGLGDSFAFRKLWFKYFGLCFVGSREPDTGLSSLGILSRRRFFIYCFLSTPSRFQQQQLCLLGAPELSRPRPTASLHRACLSHIVLNTLYRILEFRKCLGFERW